MKVLVAGAGIGGLVSAGKLAELGLEVEVLEKSPSIEKMRYDWHDDVAPKIFRRLGIEIPKEHWKKAAWTFCTTGENTVREMQQDETDPDLSIERGPLNKVLADYATTRGAKIRFGVSVTGPITKDNRVIGLMVDGKEEYADFVLDSAGVDSVVRSNLPEEFKIIKAPNKDEVFEVYRAFVKKTPGVPEPKYTNKVYMMHMNKPGISWSVVDVSDPTCMNVLVGRIAELPKDEFEAAWADLKEYNPLISDEVVRGGYFCRIPVRFPATRMIANGYALIGDAAFMTIPMLGSGIASSMLSASLLAETVADSIQKGIKDEAIFDAENLWSYQYKVFQEFGAQHLGVDAIKRWLLNCEYIDWLFGSPVLSNADLSASSSGGELKMTTAQKLQKVKACGLKSLPRLMQLLPMLNQQKKANKLGKAIPKTYCDKAIDNWEAKIKKVMYK